MSNDTDGGTYFVSRFELTKNNADFTSYIIHNAASKGHYMPIYISSFDSDFAYNVKDIGNDITSETITDGLAFNEAHVSVVKAKAVLIGSSLFSLFNTYT